MNETFEKLKLRAIREADVSHIDFDNLSHTDIRILGDAAVEKKLVELIVRECIKICDKVYEQNDNVKIQAGATFCREDIKEHFGVE